MHLPTFGFANMKPQFLLFAIAAFICYTAQAADSKPNFIVIFTDDQGYGDVGCFGSTTIRTPNLDRMAKEGRKFTSFMVASSVCSPSRAALMTGCYPKRVGMHKGVLFPGSTTGLNPNEHTIADHLKQQGYTTACFGKWHLGHHPEVLPPSNGFDMYFGIPYSNDMNHPKNEGKPEGGPQGMDELWKDPESTLTKWNTPLFENDKIVELPVDQRTITRRCTDRAVSFIEQNQGRPFFVYLPYSMPHIPLYVPDDVRDPDPKRAYINTIEHLDSEIGRLFESLRRLKLAENTYVIFATDNGPWLPFKHHGGSAGPLRDGKMSTFEGGQRVPCIMWAPGRIPADTACDSLASTIDLLPTIAALTSTPLPDDRSIDGVDISSLLFGGAKSPREEFLYFNKGGRLEGIRIGDWKLLMKQPQDKQDGDLAKSEVMLFDLAADLGERSNLAAANPEIVERLRLRMIELDAGIEAAARPVWRIPPP
ncbi:Arylsulfatase [Novipirellula artificiosorum]|uniref:Arylsulfatase n=2 Tax=Novipirellula artificiosorum TaxID=2528016 RepID=A0A5C6D4L0_9BACT|nr:Arylsulfatase [Novipirellula artificiosorum]